MTRRPGRFRSAVWAALAVAGLLAGAACSAPVEARIATVDVSKNFAFGIPQEQIFAFAQVVFTAVDVGGVTGVLFAYNGKPQEVLAGDGSSQSAPLGRASYPQVTPR